MVCHIKCVFHCLITDWFDGTEHLWVCPSLWPRGDTGSTLPALWWSWGSCENHLRSYQVHVNKQRTKREPEISFIQGRLMVDEKMCGNLLFVWALNPVVFGIGDFHGLVHLNILMEITGNLCKMKFEFNFMLSNKIHLNCCPMIITVIPVHVYLRQDYPIILWFLWDLNGIKNEWKL